MSDALPSLADLLRCTCFAEIARAIGKPRGYAWRLAHGQPLRDPSLIPALAKALHQSESFLQRVCANDARREEHSA